MGLVIHMKTIRRILSMSPAAWEVVIRALQLSCVMLFCAWMLLLDGGVFTADTAHLYRLARELMTLPQAVLLIAALASVLIEERQAS